MIFSFFMPLRTLGSFNRRALLGNRGGRRGGETSISDLQVDSSVGGGKFATVNWRQINATLRRLLEWSNSGRAIAQYRLFERDN